MASDTEIYTGKLRLSEQAALILNINHLVEQSATDASSSQKNKSYKHFVTFRTNNAGGHLDITRNLYRNDNIYNFLLKSKTSLLSSLLPSIELYKVFFPKQDNKSGGYAWRIPFDHVSVKASNTSEYVEQSLDNLIAGEGRLNGVGIKSFKYRYAGVNPAEANTNIEADLELFFQSVEDLVKVIEVPPNHPNFRSSSRPQNSTKGLTFSFTDLVSDVAMYTNTNLQQKYNPLYYRLKAVIGYTEPPQSLIDDILQGSGLTSDIEQHRINLLNTIRRSKIILYLNPHNHDISFEENGTITLKISYIASTTSLLASINCFEVEDQYHQLKKLEEEYKEASKSKKEEIDQINKNCYEKTEKEIEKERDAAEDRYRPLLIEKEFNLENQKNIIYANFFTKMTKGNTYAVNLNAAALGLDNFATFSPKSESAPASSIDLVKKRNENLQLSQAIINYQLIGNPETIERYGINKYNQTLITKFNSTSLSTFDTAKKEKEKFDRLREDLIQRLQTIKEKQTDLSTEEKQQLESILAELGAGEGFNLDNFLGRVKTIAGSTSAFVYGLFKDSKKYSDDTLQYIKDYLPSITRENDIINLRTLQNNNFKVEFVFLGDILDTVAFLCDNFNATERPRIILPNILVKIPKKTIPQSPGSEEDYVVNIADIPISLNMLQHFFIEKIIKPRRSNYPLLAFITDIMMYVINPAISPASLGTKNYIRMSTLALSIPFLSDNDVITNEYKNNFSGNITSTSKIIQNMNNLFNDPNSFYGDFGNYIILYCSSQIPNNLLGNAGDITRDKQDGVYHYFVGTDSSILKKISFSRTNTPFYKEAVATNEGATSQGRLREVYDSTLSMFGNNIYRPGDYIYIEPLFFTGNLAVELQNKIGLGGYYQIIDSEVSINESNYETTLKAVLYGHIAGDKIISNDGRGGC